MAGLKSELRDRIGPATFPAETTASLTVALNSPDVGGLATAIAQCLDNLNAADAAARRERVRRLVQTRDDLDQRLRHAERAVRRWGEIAIVTLAPPAEQPPIHAANPEPVPIPPPIPEPDGVEPAPHRDDRLRPLIERRNAARERLKRTEERVLPGSPILAREIAELAEIERSVSEALAEARPEIERAMPHPPPPPVAAPKPPPSPAELQEGRASLAARLAALSATEARELHALKVQRDAANRDLLELERTLTQPRYRLAGTTPNDTHPNRQLGFASLAGLVGFLFATLMPLPNGRRTGTDSAT